VEAADASALIANDAAVLLAFHDSAPSMELFMRVNSMTNSSAFRTHELTPARSPIQPA
jgi:hypothetical protein